LRQQAKKARASGFNHVALEVGGIDEALALYARRFDFELRGRSKTSAFIDLGDKFLALQKGRAQAADDGRHFGLVVDNKDAVRRALRRRAWIRCPVDFSTSSIREATISRSSATKTSSSPRRPTCCAA
jgi:Glyoxalase/Bleomycin resistance protein/Dioxygenase superfamily